MNGLPWTLTVLAVGTLIAVAGALIIGYRLDRRCPPRVPRLTAADLVPLCLCDLCLTDEDAALLAHVRGDR